MTRLGEPQRFRELLVEPHELQQLPPTAMVLTHAIGNRRQVMLVDVNPGIITLPRTHALEYEDYLREQSEPDQPHLRQVRPEQLGTGEGGGATPPGTGALEAGAVNEAAGPGNPSGPGDAGTSGPVGSGGPDDAAPGTAIGGPDDAAPGTAIGRPDDAAPGTAIGEPGEAGDAGAVGETGEAVHGAPKRARARHAATRGVVRRYRRSATPRSTNATPPPSLGPPSERLDFRRGKP